LLDAARRRHPEIADLVTVLASTGMRVGEVLGLRWSAVELSLARCTSLGSSLMEGRALG